MSPGATMMIPLTNHRSAPIRLALFPPLWFPEIIKWKWNRTFREDLGWRVGQEWARRQRYRVVDGKPHSKRASGGQQLVAGQHLRLMRREPG